MAITGKLIKINAQKKLVIKIDKSTYDTLLKRMQTLAKKLGYTNSHFAVSSYEDDFGDEQYRLKVKLDKYDILNMSKFEAYIRDDVAVTGTMKPWAWIPDGETEQKYVINYELSSIRRIKPKPIVSEEIDAEVDQIAAAAEARVLSTDTKLTAEEEEIDDFVEQAAAAAINSEMSIAK